ncbi:MAG: Immunoglobulin-like repeat containing protein domain [Bacteroidota bacterium]|nr:Immunoglobulin-like repeat containing protein domain [Bacteroidota bacterium]
MKRISFLIIVSLIQSSLIFACNSSSTVTVTANPTVICAGDSAQLCATSGFVSYQWNSGASGQCIYVHFAGNYYVTATDNIGCTAVSNHLPISVHPVPPVSVSVNDDTLMAYNAASYQWYLNGSPINGATSSMYIALASGSYSVLVTDTSGCLAQSSNVNVTVSLSASLGPSQSVCRGTTDTLRPLVSGGLQPYSYSWSSSADSLSCSLCQNPVVTIHQNSVFTVTVTDANNLTAVTSVSYTLSSACINCTSGPSACIPNGAVIGSGFENPDTTPCIVQNITYNHAIQFNTYSTINFQGTQNVDSIQFVHVDSLPCGLCWSTCHANNTFRANEAGCLDINGITNDEVGQYKLSLGLKVWINGNTLPLTLSPVLLDQLGIKLWVRVRSTSGQCLSVDTSASAFNLSTNPANCQNQSFLVDLGAGQNFCSGTSTILAPIISGGQGPYTYLWSSTGDALSCDTCANPSVTITQNSIITVTVTDISNVTGTATVTYSTGALLSLQVTANGSTNFCTGDSVTLTAASGFTNYHWSNGLNSESIVASVTGVYNVTASTTGCSATGSIGVTVFPLPAIQSIVGSPSIVPFQVYVYAVNAVSGINYYWNAQNGAVQSGQLTNSANIIWNATGPYLLQLVQTNNATGCSDTLTLDILTGINDLSPSNPIVYSFYSNGTNTIQVNFGRPVVYSLKLYETSGRLVMSIPASAANQITVPGTISKGIYMVEISGKDLLHRSKIFVQ